MNKNGILLEEAMVAALSALDGMADRVCPIVDIQKSSGPLAVFDQLKEKDDQHLNGKAGLVEAAFQIHVLHNTYKKMRMLSESVKSALESLWGYADNQLLIESVSVELGSPDIWETKVSLFRRTYNVTFFYQVKEE